MSSPHKKVHIYSNPKEYDELVAKYCSHRNVIYEFVEYTSNDEDERPDEYYIICKDCGSYVGSHND